jgi:beta-phosphoglucomutase
MIKGVIFDLDGVLVSTDEYHYLAWKFIADREGIPFDREINHRQRGVSRMESLEVLLEQASRRYSDAEKLALAEDKNQHYVEYLSRIRPEDTLPGARACLQVLRRLGIKVAVGSSSRNTPTILRQTQLEELLDAVADGNDISRSKPDPEVFLLAAERLGLAPAECLVVEDAPAGIEAGRRAGMPCLGIGTDETLPGVSPRVPTLADLAPEAMLRITGPHASP